jgi:DNA-binding LacI/PurR family transcriptional regulator
LRKSYIGDRILSEKNSRFSTESFDQSPILSGEEMQVTIIDIARYTGISKSTVSRVLNDSGPVAAETKKKVLDAVKTLNYKPNAVARNLVLKRSNSFSLIVQDIRNPYYAYVSWLAERIFSERGFNLDIFNADNNLLLEKKALESVKYRRIDGILCVGGGKDATNIIDFYSREGIPIVLIDREVQGYDIPKINLDNLYGAKLATDYLFKLGHRRIVFITSDLTLPERHRMEGFIESCREKGVPQADSLVISQSEEDWTRGVCVEFEELFTSSAPPTAVFASNDIKALRAIRLLKQQGYSVPEDVSVMGYDDIDISSIVVPSLTTIHQPIDDMIEAGATMLLSIVAGKGRIEWDQEKLKPWLVERESTRAV